MKCKILLTLAFVFLAGCNDSPKTLDNPDFKTVVDPALESYFQTFTSYAKGYGRPLSMNIEVAFASRPLIPNQMNVVGVCVKYSGSAYIYKTAKVYIAEDYWQTISETTREHLMFHELGHCLLDRGHTTTSIAWTTGGQSYETPISLMYPNMFSQNPIFTPFVQNNFSAYLDELFTLNFQSLLAFGPIYNQGNSASGFVESVQVMTEDGSCDH